MTKVKKDGLGLYINVGGYICRPFFGTCFQEGDEVKAHHFGGSTRIGVGLPGPAMFRKSETYEYWSTTGTGMWEMKYPERWTINGKKYKQWASYVKACAVWYQEHACGSAEHNKKYARDSGRRYNDKAYYA